MKCWMVGVALPMVMVLVGAANAWGDIIYTVTELGSLGGTGGVPSDINSSGQVVGASYMAGDTAYHAFLYSNGGMTDLRTFGGSYSAATAINSNGQVVGEAHTAGNTERHAFLYSNGSMTDLGTLGGTNSRANDINNSGDVVGQASYMAGSGSQHAFLYSNGIMTDLNSLIQLGSGWMISEAMGINDTGQIVAYATRDLGEFRALLLSPDTSTVPEPSTLAMFLGLGGMGLIAAWRRRKRTA